jgi:hypothetical protein
MPRGPRRLSPCTRPSARRPSPQARTSRAPQSSGHLPRDLPQQPGSRPRLSEADTVAQAARARGSTDSSEPVGRPERLARWPGPTRSSRIRAAPDPVNPGQRSRALLAIRSTSLPPRRRASDRSGPTDPRPRKQSHSEWRYPSCARPGEPRPAQPRATGDQEHEPPAQKTRQCQVRPHWPATPATLMAIHPRQLRPGPRPTASPYGADRGDRAGDPSRPQAAQQTSISSRVRAAPDATRG